MLGWEAGIRTPIPWSRATCPTVGRPPSASRGAPQRAGTSILANRDSGVERARERASADRAPRGAAGSDGSPSDRRMQVGRVERTTDYALLSVADHRLGIAARDVVDPRPAAAALLLLLPTMARHAALAAGLARLFDVHSCAVPF